jgi:cytochrome c556
MWQDVESFQASEEVFTSDVERFIPFLEKPPEVGYHKVDSITLI